MLILTLSPLQHGALVLLNLPPQPASVVFFRIESVLVFLYELQELRQNKRGVLREGIQSEVNHLVQLFPEVIFLQKSNAAFCLVFCFQAAKPPDNFFYQNSSFNKPPFDKKLDIDQTDFAFPCGLISGFS